VGIHSKILVHWTGKDIESNPSANKSQLYVERLIDDLQNGLFTKRTTEAVIRKKKIKHLVRICFTEIRLSQARTHAERYGKLGIGFTRDFIMNKGGRPVIYIPFEIREDGHLLENLIRTVYDKSTGNDEIHKSTKWIMAHVKRMSNEKGEDYYEEMEWRLVHDESPNNRHFIGEGQGVYRMRFAIRDIKVIIFPDEGTKQLALKNDVMKKHISKHMPMMATLEDCDSF
jgi:hypothetical protein